MTNPPDTIVSALPEDDGKLCKRLRESAKAFRDHPVYSQDGDPVKLTVQAQECEEAATRIETLSREIERAAAVERKAIVDWLREQGTPMLPCDAGSYADAIENCEHHSTGSGAGEDTKGND